MLAVVRAEDQSLYELARGLSRGRLALGEQVARFTELNGPAALGFSTTEEELLSLALTGRVTVHAMRDYLRADEPSDDEAESERCTLEEVAPADVVMLVEATHTSSGARAGAPWATRRSVSTASSGWA